LQLIGTAQSSFGSHLAELERIADTDPLKLEPMRTDLTVDVAGVAMSWVLRHARVEAKRFSAQLGKVEAERDGYMAIAGRELETYYCGKRPNCFRVYNKTAERMAAYKNFMRGWYPPEPSFAKWSARASKRSGPAFVEFERGCLLRGLSPDLEIEKAERALESLRFIFDDLHAAWVQKCAAMPPVPSFQNFCGLDEFTVLTRFERQIGAQQIKRIYRPGDVRKIPIFQSLAELRANLPDFNPFLPVSFSSAGVVDLPLPHGANYSVAEYIAGLYYRLRVEEQGRQAADSWVRSLDPKHSGRHLDKFAAFAPADAGEGAVLSSRGLYERYRCAIEKQLAA
jgi:hypothetical protein